MHQEDVESKDEKSSQRDWPDRPFDPDVAAEIERMQTVLSQRNGETNGRSD
jgi:hypothetical protein